MRKTSINITESVTSVGRVPDTSVSLAMVLSNPIRGCANKVYTVSTLSDFIRIFGNGGTEQYQAARYFLSSGILLKVAVPGITGDSVAKASARLNYQNAVSDGGSAGGVVFTAVESGIGYNGITIKATKLNTDNGLDVLFKLDIYETSEGESPSIKYRNLLESYPMVSLNPVSDYYYTKTVRSDIITMKTADGSGNSIFKTSDTKDTVVSAVLGNGVGTYNSSDLAGACLNFSDMGIQFVAGLIPGVDGSTAWTAWSAVVALRKDFVVLVDAGNISVEDAISNTSGVQSSFAVTAYPRVTMLNWGDNISPIYALASRLVSMHTKHELYKSPAGIQQGALPEVVDVAETLTTSQIGKLQESNINPVVVKAGSGVVLWGDATRGSVAEIVDLSTRLLVNYFKREAYRISQQFIFQPNISYTWNQWRNTVEPIVRDVYNANGLLKYEVLCGEETMSQEEILQGTMRGVIKIWPTSKIKEIIIEFNVDETGITVESSI